MSNMRFMIRHNTFLNMKTMLLFNTFCQLTSAINSIKPWIIVLITGLFPLLSCVKADKMLNSEHETEIDTIPYTDRMTAGILENKDITEASGMAAFVSMPGRFWVHNDSGDSARLFVINETGGHVAEVRIKGAENRDWEDIATCTDPSTQQPVCIIADIGDNLARYDHGIIYLVHEPAGGIRKDTTLEIFRRLIFRYPDGPRDAETLMADPVTGDVYIVSKRESAVGVYRIAYPYPADDTLVTEKIMTLPLTQVVAGDISADGREILLKNYDFVYYFTRKEGETIQDALSRQALKLPYTREPQGESICFSKDGKTFYTVSETTAFKIPPVLYKYGRK